MPTRLIINADDFGFSRAVTDGILRCHTHGILTSTTLMTTMPDRDRAIDIAHQHPSLGVGIHLSLTQGTPLTPCRRLLSRAHGTFFRSLPKLLWRLRSPAARQEAAAELHAQIAYAQARRLTPTHLDSHKHVCHLPPLHAPLIHAANATGISHIRTAREVRIPHTPPMSPPYCVLARCAAQLARKIHAAGLHTTDWFFGLATTGRTDAAIWNALANAPPAGLGEVMVHPGYIQDITAADTRLLDQRLREMHALCDPAVRTALSTARITLVHFGDTPQKQP